MVTGSTVERGYGVENQWVIEALGKVADMAAAGRLKDDPLYQGSPELSPQEAIVLRRMIDGGKVGVRMLGQRALTYMDYHRIGKGSDAIFRIDMRPDVAAVVRGIAGFDPVVYPTNNKSFVQMAKEISLQAGKMWPEFTH